jgi:hypothetical protein
MNCINHDDYVGSIQFFNDNIKKCVIYMYQNIDNKEIVSTCCNEITFAYHQIKDCEQIISSNEKGKRYRLYCEEWGKIEI